MELESAGLTHVGRRKNNEDSWLVAPELGLFVVADGMGGYEGGEVASRIVIETLREFFERNAEDSDVTWPFGLDSSLSLEENLVSVGLRAANKEVLAQKEGVLSQMGSTAVVLVARARSVILGHVGDSRIYRLRDGRIEQLTADHSLRAELERAGHEPLPPGQFDHVITRALGMREQSSPELRREEVREGDVFLLCSDGLTDPLDDEDIEEVLQRLPPAGACRILVDRALEAGGHDNITVVVVAFGRQDGISP